jgi:hypothetical protein
MGYGRLCVFTAMGYDRVDCTTIIVELWSYDAFKLLEWLLPKQLDDGRTVIILPYTTVLEIQFALPHHHPKFEEFLIKAQYMLRDIFESRERFIKPAFRMALIKPKEGEGGLVFFPRANGWAAGNI